MIHIIPIIIIVLTPRLGCRVVCQQPATENRSGSLRLQPLVIDDDGGASPNSPATGLSTRDMLVRIFDSSGFIAEIPQTYREVRLSDRYPVGGHAIILMVASLLC